MRISEFIALKPEDIDFDKGLVEVRRGCVKRRVGPTKNRPKRKVDMSPALPKVLKDWLVSRKRESLQKGWANTPRMALL